MTGSSSLILLTILAPAYALVLASPGPNLLVVMRASLSRSAADTSAAALGIGCGAGTLALCALLLATCATQGALEGARWVEAGGRLVFALLLARAGWRSLRPRPGLSMAEALSEEGHAGVHFRFGLLAALSNPLTVPFFATFFLGHPETHDARVAAGACLLVLAMAVGWFGAIGLLLARFRWRERMGRSGRWPERAIGCALLGCAIMAAWPLHAYAGW